MKDRRGTALCLAGAAASFALTCLASPIASAASVGIASVAFPGVVLRLDGNGVVVPPIGSGGGTVNAQFGVSLWERFVLHPQPSGTVAIESVAFPGVYLRLDGSGVVVPSGSGGGTVNAQSTVGPWEEFWSRRQPSGNVAFESAAFPKVFLRLDGTGVAAPTGSGGGVVNAQYGVGAWEEFRLVAD